MKHWNKKQKKLLKRAAVFLCLLLACSVGLGIYHSVRADEYAGWLVNGNDYQFESIISPAQSGATLKYRTYWYMFIGEEGAEAQEAAVDSGTPGEWDSSVNSRIMNGIFSKGLEIQADTVKEWPKEADGTYKVLREVKANVIIPFVKSRVKRENMKDRQIDVYIVPVTEGYRIKRDTGATYSFQKAYCLNNALALRAHLVKEPGTEWPESTQTAIESNYWPHHLQLEFTYVTYRAAAMCGEEELGAVTMGAENEEEFNGYLFYGETLRPVSAPEYDGYTCTGYEWNTGKSAKKTKTTAYELKFGELPEGTDELVLTFLYEKVEPTPTPAGTPVPKDKYSITYVDEYYQNGELYKTDKPGAKTYAAGTEIKDTSLILEGKTFDGKSYGNGTIEIEGNQTGLAIENEFHVVGKLTNDATIRRKLYWEAEPPTPTPAGHSHTYKIYYDEWEHWKECTKKDEEEPGCTVPEKDRGEHIWKESKREGCVTTYKCSTSWCKAQYTSADHDTGPFIHDNVNYPGYHWRVCANCGAIDEYSRHVLGDAKAPAVPDGYSYKYCQSDCGYYERVRNVYYIAFHKSTNDDGQISMPDQTMMFGVEDYLNGNKYFGQFLVSYDARGGSCSYTTENTTAPAIFLGWALSEGGTPVYADKELVLDLTTENLATVHLYAQWETDSVLLPSATKTGYTFSHWTPDSLEAAEKLYAGNRYVPPKDITLYAHWTPRNDTVYTVQYWLQKVDAGENPDTDYVLQEYKTLKGTTDSFVSPEPVVYEGFVAPQKQTKQILPDGSMVINYYYNRQHYSLALECGEGTERTTGGGTYDYGAEVEINAFTASGYRFKEWVGKQTFTSQKTTITIDNTIADDSFRILLTAATDKNASTLTVDPVGGVFRGKTAPTAVAKNAGEKEIIENPTRTGYIFKGWELSGTFTCGTLNGTQFTFSSAYGGVGTLYARWEAAPVIITVNHWKQNTGGGTAHNTTNFTLAESEQLSAVADEYMTPKTRTTYTGFTAPQETAVKVAADGSTVVDYYYTRNEYVLTVTAGTGIKSVTGGGTYDYGTEVTISAVPADGYHWGIWNQIENSPAGMKVQVGGQADYTAKYEAVMEALQKCDDATMMSALKSATLVKENGTPIFITDYAVIEQFVSTCLTAYAARV